MRVSSYLSGGPVPGTSSYAMLHGYTGALEIIPDDIGRFLIDRRGEALGDDFAAIEQDPTISRLVSRGFLTQANEAAERASIVGISGALRSMSLARAPTAFMIVPSLKCNLRCPYCFQSHEMHKGKGGLGKLMTAEQIDTIFDLIDRFAPPGSIGRALRGETLPPVGGATSIGLFGGEPLMRETRPAVDMIHARARERGMTMSAVTNAVELDAFEDLLGAHGLASLQVTLDGMREWHDRRRVGPEYKATFDIISRNLTMALEKGVSISLRINVDTDNLQHIDQLDDHFRAMGWYAYPDFQPYAAAVDALSPQSARKMVSHGEVYGRTESLRGDAGRISSYEGRAEELVRRIMLEPDVFPFDKAENCASETGQLIFDPLGDVYACWEDVGTRSLRIGTFHPQTIDFDPALTQAWLHRFPGAIDQCSQCPFALIHVSGCAAHARSEHGAIGASACEGFPDYFPRALGAAVARFADAFKTLDTALVD